MTDIDKTERVRLDRFLSESTELTRSQAKRVLRQREVSVDGVVVRDAKLSVSDDNRVCWQGERLQRVGFRYLMMHKPLGVECSSRPTHHESVLDLIEIEQRERLHPVGRLDVDTTGLLLISDDGNWAHRVTSPNRQCLKRYRATLAAPITQAQAQEVAERFAAGVALQDEDTLTRPATFERENERVVWIGVTEGRYHQVKRMLAAVGHPLESLHRESIGALTLDPNLAPGECRHLSADEIASF